MHAKTRRNSLDYSIQSQRQRFSITRKTFYKNGFSSIQETTQNVVKIFLKYRISCLKTRQFPTQHVKFANSTCGVCHRNTSRQAFPHVKFLHKTRQLTHFMQSYSPTPQLNSLIIKQTLCTPRIDSIRPSLVSPHNTPFSEGQKKSKFLTNRPSDYCLIPKTSSNSAYFKMGMPACCFMSVRSRSPLTI